MELYVKEQFTKAIAICGDKPEYENVKDFMQDMIDDNVAMAAKDTPVHMLKFMQTAAYNPQFTEEFRECMENVLYMREIDDKATMFHMRKLRNVCSRQSELIKDYAEQLRMSQFKHSGQFGPGDQVDEANRMKRIEENVRVVELEKLKEINGKLFKENNDLREEFVRHKQEIIDAYEKERKTQKDAIMSHLDKSVNETIQVLVEKYGANDERLLKKCLLDLERKNRIKIENDTVRIIRKGYHGDEISEYESVQLRRMFNL